jgi:hypothetical protein
MPLYLPYAYIVTYALKNPNLNYAPFFEELQRSQKWSHYIDNTWVVLRTDTLQELGSKLRPLIFQEDRLLIMPAKGPSDGWLPAEAWTWIQENVPNEW